MKRLDVLLTLAVCAVLAAAPASAQAMPFLQAQTATTDARVLTPTDVARLRSVGQVAIRPDGSAIAYTLSVPREAWPR
jgi:hypothetical protein